MKVLVPILEATNISVCFGRGRYAVTALDKVCLTIGEGEAHALIGESGCGKSTLLRTLIGLNTVYKGSVRFKGEELVKCRFRAFYRQVQMIFQDPYSSLHPRKMVGAVLSEVLQIHGICLDNVRLRNKMVVETLEAVGLNQKFIYRYPHELSGGERQRVAIARSLIIKPSLILLDEPTSSLDVLAQAEILNLLTSLRRESQLTYLLVTHDIAVATNLCDHIMIMRNGLIVERLSADQVRTRELSNSYTRDFLSASIGYQLPADKL